MTESSTTVQTSADSEIIELPVTTVPVAKKQEYEVVNLLSEFAVEPRRLNEAGTKRAVDFISDKLDSYGWIVSKEEFPVYRYADVISEPYNLGGDSEIMGTGVNVIADMPRYDENKCTIILSAHYDTTKDNIGIIDNGSGTALLLSAAEMLSDANPDFNIRLIFFDMEEYSMYGSKYYLLFVPDSQYFMQKMSEKIKFYNKNIANYLIKTTKNERNAYFAGLPIMLAHSHTTWSCWD